MNGSKAQILAQLEREIMPLQGLRSSVQQSKTDVGLSVIKAAFPNQEFPLEAVHEFCCNSKEEFSASAGFVAGILSSLMRNGSAGIWIASSPTIFPPALVQFHISPQHLLFIQLKKEKEILWALEEALKCGSVAAVVGELQDLSFTASRRLQLAIEKSGVPLFLLRHRQKNFSTSCVTRWHVQPAPSETEEDLPGVGSPRWKIDLLKVRNGYPGSWIIEWRSGRFRTVKQQATIVPSLQRKTG